MMRKRGSGQVRLALQDLRLFSPDRLNDFSNTFGGEKYHTEEQIKKHPLLRCKDQPGHLY